MNQVLPAAVEVDRDVVLGSILCTIDDKQVPLYRVMWVSTVPHFCGHEDCLYEGRYEIRLEQEESVWGNREERDRIIVALEKWQGGLGSDMDTDADSDFPQ